LLQQESHLVAKDSTACENHELRPIWDIRQIEQRHTHFFRRPVVFLVVAVLACRDPIRPGVSPIATARKNVVAGELQIGELPAAVGTHMPIAFE